MVICRTWWALLKIRLYNQGASVHAMKACGKLSVQFFVTRWTSMVSLTPQPLQFQEKSTRQPLNRQLHRSQNLSGPFGVEKTLLSMPGSRSSPQQSQHRLHQAASRNSNSRVLYQIQGAETKFTPTAKGSSRQVRGKMRARQFSVCKRNNPITNVHGHVT